MTDEQAAASGWRTAPRSARPGSGCSGCWLNNSLAAIRSIAGGLVTLVSRNPMPEHWQEDAQRGLAVIASRAEALTRFMEAYSELVRLPQPKFQPVDLAACIERVQSLEMRLPVAVTPGPSITVQAPTPTSSSNCSSIS